MTGALLRKEAREHGVVLGLLLLIAALGFLFFADDSRDAGSAFVALRKFTVGFGVLLALVVNNRLVVREYSARTQLFLETLPVGRGRVLAVKYLLGAGLVVAVELAALAGCTLAALQFEPVTPRYVALVGARAVAFALAFHALAFLAGFLGRFRVGLWLGVVLTWFTLESIKKVEVLSLPLLRLVGEQMPFERQVVPWGDLAIALALTLALLGLAAALALARDGTVAAQLAQRMRPREKVFFACAALGYVVLLYLLDTRAARPRFELAEATRAAAGETVVAMGTAPGLDAARALDAGRLVAEDLDALRRWLDLDALPAVFVLPNHGLDADVFRRARLPKADGVVVQAALADPALDPRELRAFVVWQVLDWHSRRRAQREARRWLLDGFARWWVLSREPGGPPPTEALRSAEAARREDLRAGTLARWLSARERLGDCLADALAARVVAVLADRLGPERFQAFARSAFSKRPPDDLRAFLTERSVESLLAAQSGPTLGELGALAREAVEASRPSLAPGLAQVRRFVTEAQPAPASRASLEVRLALRPDPDAGPVDYTVLYRALQPWADELTRVELSRFDTRGRGVLPQTFPRGTRLFSAFEVREPALGCAVRLDARRWELR